MNTFRIIGTTIGEGNAAHVDKWKPYVWNGDPAKADGAPAERRVPGNLRGSPKKRAEEKAARFAEFCRLRAEGVDVIPAGREVGVERRAASRYEQQRKAELREAS